MEYIPDIELLRKNQAFINSLKLKKHITESKIETLDELRIEYFFFDPNTIEISELRNLGFNERIIANIGKYRNKGGRFIKPEDLKIIYGLSKEKYLEVEKWINIEPEEFNNDISEEKKVNLSVDVIKEDYELNSITYRDLILLTGNAKLTGRILNYKKLLGGYYSVKQLLEVYEMNDSIYKSINHEIKVDTIQIETLSINLSSYSDLLRHPYLKKLHVDIIMKYREYKNSEIDLKEFIYNQILPDSTIIKIRPYLRN
ncbi:MAG: helix-hairpin-helix domain-containing protein [Bacteroidales bacterium]|nr:helix-hairpin-helix domain-containing protein [Bacteroidales bacterium]